MSTYLYLYLNVKALINNRYRNKAVYKKAIFNREISTQRVIQIYPYTYIHI